MLFTHEKPDFQTDGLHWPHRSASRFVEAGGIRFHAQTVGSGPELVMLHGTGASTHSFRAMMPLLAAHFRVTAVDLPGHGFTGTPIFTQMTLPGVSSLTAKFLAADGIVPDVLVGHSTGVAVALRMVLDGLVPPVPVIGFNASLKPYAGAAAPIFSALAKVLFVNPMTPRVFAATATKRRVARILASTGSRLDGEGAGYYRTLFRRSGHVNGALSLMAGLDLVPLQRDLSKLKAPLTLVVAAGDRTIPPSVSADVVAKVPNGHLVRVPRLGHLAHEEDPAGSAQIVLDAYRATKPDETPGET